MSFQTCLSKLKDHLKESGLEKNISKKRIEQIAKQLETVAGDSLTPAEFAAKAQEFIDGNLLRDQAAMRAVRAQALFIREQAFRNMTSNVDRWKADIAKGVKGTPEHMAYEAFRSWQYGGSLRGGFDSNTSPFLVSARVEAKLWNTFRQALGADLERFATTGKLDYDALVTLGKIDRGLPLTGVDAKTIDYAKALKVVRDKVFSMEQARNPLLRPASDYLWAQMHDRTRIQEMGKEKWVDLAMKTYGQKSFAELEMSEKPEKFGDIYDKIVAGKWGSNLPDGVERSRGPNVFQNQARPRSLIANDDKAFADYQMLAGPKTVYDGMSQIISRSSRDIALVQKAGPAYDMTRDMLYQRFKQSLPENEAAHLESKKASLDRDWRVVKGAQDSPARGGFAKFSQGLMTWQWLSKGGLALMHAAPGDISLGASLLNDLSRSGLATHAFEISHEYFKALPAGEYRNARLQDAGMFMSAAQHEILRRAFGAPDAAPGAMGKMSQRMSTYSGYNLHIDAMNSAIGTVLTRHLGRMTEFEHSKLPTSWQQGLARYGIGETEWNVMRLAGEKFGGNQHLTPESVQDLPREALENYLRKSGQWNREAAPSEALLQKTRDDLDTKLGAMINEHAQLSTGHSDLRQKAFMFGDTNINEGMGQLRRFLWQFKQATQVSGDVYRRNYFAGADTGGSYRAPIQHMALAVFLAAGAGAITQMVAQGKTPENPFASPEGILKLAVGSGVMGAYGSVLEGELSGADKTNNAFTGMKAVTGPVIGSLLEGGAILGAGLNAKPGRKSSFGRDAAKWLTSNAPLGVNTFVWSKAAFDYYIGNQFKEFAGPGYLRSLERHTAKTPGIGDNQKYLFATPTGQPGVLTGGN